MFCRALPLFGSVSTISRFGERFGDGQHSLVSFLFSVLLIVPPVPYVVGATRVAIVCLRRTTYMELITSATQGL